MKFDSIKPITKKFNPKELQTKKRVMHPLINKLLISKFYFVKRELFTPACSHFLIIGLRNDMGRAVKIANETTRIKSVVK